MKFNNPHGCVFEPTKDIIDKNSILDFILKMNISKQKEVCKFILSELGDANEELKLDTTIAELINFLYDHEPTRTKLDISVLPFEIDRKIDFNRLDISRGVIEELCVYSPDISDKYSIYDQEGVNKSKSVIHTISKFYREEAIRSQNSDEIFLKVADRIADFALKSGNFVHTTRELLQLSAEILTVDTFLRCKIFKNPLANASS